MATTRKRGAGQRVLEGRHVLGLFLLMLVFSGVFFALGYVMGRNQYDGMVAAAGNPPRVNPVEVPPIKPEPLPKRGGKNAPTAPVAAPAAKNNDSEGANDWEGSSRTKESDEHLKPGAFESAPAARNGGANVDSSARTPAANSDVPAAKASAPGGSYTLQVTAVRKQSDAMELARHLQKKKFPAFVMAPQGNEKKYYRVQVGPYSDLKSAEAARKGLEGAGFRAIVKRG
jgi:septal ring-binding cell division protein DamX